MNTQKLLLLLPAAFLAGSVLPAAQELNPRFTRAHVQGDAFVMEVAGVVDSSCALEAAEDLSSVWREVPLPRPISDGLIEVTIDRDQRFLRLRCGDLISANTAGYVRMDLQSPFPLIANPFVTGDNTLPEVFGEDVPFGATVYRFDAQHQAYTATQFGIDGWLDSDQTLATGEGAFLLGWEPSPLVLGGLLNPPVSFPELEGGWNLVGLPAGVNAVPGEIGDAIFELGPDNSYHIYEFEFGEWGEPPLVRLGEGFWYRRAQPGASPPIGGCVLFSNFASVLGGVGAPQFDIVGCRSEGTNFLAQLHAGPDAGSLVDIGEPVPFLTGEGAGFFDTGSNAVRYIPAVAAGDQAAVQVRMWSAEHGATYEEAVAAGGQHGQSQSFSIYTGGSGEPPSLPVSLVGLTSTSGLAHLVTDIDGDTWVIQGNTARFSVEHNYLGTRPASYQWQRESQDGAWVDLSGATGSTLELGPVDLGDTGNYRVFVDVGCISEHSFPIALHVLNVPSFANPYFERATGSFGFLFAGDMLRGYAIEVSTDLVNWNLLRTVVNLAEPIEIWDTETGGAQYRFYRARDLAE